MFFQTAIVPTSFISVVGLLTVFSMHMLFRNINLIDCGWIFHL